MHQFPRYFKPPGHIKTNVNNISFICNVTLLWHVRQACDGSATAA
jgi:hypothetical protein